MKFKDLACVIAVLSVAVPVGRSSRTDSCECTPTLDPVDSGGASACLTAIQCDIISVTPGECSAPPFCNAPSDCEFDLRVGATINTSCGPSCLFTHRVVSGPGWTPLVNSWYTTYYVFFSCPDNGAFTIETKCSSLCSGACADVTPKILCSWILDCNKCSEGN